MASDNEPSLSEEHLRMLSLHAMAVLAMNDEATLTRQEVRALAIAALAVIGTPPGWPERQDYDG
jgi:hypothetical protein